MAPPPPRPAGASQLLRAGPPAGPATVLTALRFSRLAGSLSPSATRRTAVSGHAFPRSMHEQQTGLTSPTCRTPPGQNTDTRQTHPGLTYYTPVLMPPDWVTTRQQRSPKTRTAHRLPDPHLTHLVRLFHIAHHDGLQPTQHVVVCSLPPQGGSEGPTFISCTAPCRKALPTNRTPLHVRGTRRIPNHVAKSRS